MNIEPGFFEWLGLVKSTQNHLPHFFTPQALIENGFKINVKYKPQMSLEKLQRKMDEDESPEQLYERNGNVTKSILENSTGNVLIVAHAMSLDTCTRPLRKLATPPGSDCQVFAKFGFCSLAAVEEDNKKRWSLVKPPSLRFTSLANKGLDWSILK